MFNLIPKPIKVNVDATKFVISSATSVSADAKLAKAVEFLAQYVKKATNIDLKRVDKDGDIRFVCDKDIAEEGYKISCKENVITVTASTYVGALYAVQTLRVHFNMDTTTNAKELTAGGVFIEDAPRYQWRGLMLDESRHFFGESEVKRLLDLMLLHKLNVLHWHLTDDTGWRIEIKKYPLLTEIGSKRKDTQIHGWGNTDLEGKPHEGFYTQEQIKDMVAYAKDRGIMIVPEIDMPGHFTAALACYPWLACREVPCEVAYYFGSNIPRHEHLDVYDRSACVGKESTYQFIFDIIDELSELFPSQYFHIGGDEAPKDEWKNCKACQDKMKEEGLATVEELQGYFTNRVYEHLKSKGKKLVGWNEVLAANNLDKEVIAQYWTYNRDKRAEEHVKNGGKVVLSKHQSFYFDMGYGEIPLKQTYKFSPNKIGIPPIYENNIIGVEGACWTEWIGDRKKLDSSLFPRLEALAEVAWSQEEKKNFDDFVVRLDSFKRILDANDVWYAEDEVSMPKGFFKRQKARAEWHGANQHLDVQLNEIAKANKKLGK